MTELVTRNDAYVARYEQTSDPYAAFANESGSMIVGKLLVCKKGSWEIGRDGDAVPTGTRMLALVPTLMRGMVKWMGGAIVDAKMGLVKDGFMVPHRYSLGDLDEDQWEKAPNGEARDPWARSFVMQLVELSPPHGDITFSGGSWGASLALKDLCGHFSGEAPAAPDTHPVVELTTRTRKDKNYGNIVGPWFNIVGWATLEDVRAGRKTAAAKPKAAKKETAATAPGPAVSSREETAPVPPLNDPLPTSWK